MSKAIADGPFTRTVVDAPSIGLEIEVLEPTQESLQSTAAEVVHALVEGSITAEVRTIHSPNANMSVLTSSRLSRQVAAEVLHDIGAAATSAQEQLEDVVDLVQAAVTQGALDEAQGALSASSDQQVDAEAESGYVFVFTTASVVKPVQPPAPAAGTF